MNSEKYNIRINLGYDDIWIDELTEAEYTEIIRDYRTAQESNLNSNFYIIRKDEIFLVNSNHVTFIKRIKASLSL